MSKRAPASIDDGAFEYATHKDGTVIVSYHGRPVTTLRGKQAAKFANRIEGLEGREAQLLMARATGNFKRGNERSIQGQNRG